CSLDAGKDKSLAKKIFSGLVYAFTDVWDDLAGWFFAGLLIAGFITALIPDELISRFLGGGLTSMLLMLLTGIPLYICATASTPVAAALIMKGISPGAALVFLIAGPATNMTSLTVLTGILGKKTLMIYLTTIALFSVTFGLMIDKFYLIMNISPQAIIGKASEMLPLWLEFTGTTILVLISVKPFCRIITKCKTKIFMPKKQRGI
ncbi:MAG: permease, partial [Deltaproteobacteria bacterium]|nr:permease [Deltaproteobacteria bacterium]